VCLVEDEPKIAQRLERFCREILGAQLELLRCVETFDEASARLDEEPFDLLLLDLNLNGEDGLELLTRSVARSFHTIIVSANTDQALRAFELGVIDFVPKPFSRERLAIALERVTGTGGRATHPTRRLALRKSGRIELVAVDDVLYVQGAGDYSELVLRDGRRELHDKSLEKLSDVLPPDFERIHKSYLARLSEIRALHAQEGSQYEAELHGGTRLPIGRTRYREIRAKFD
jgi:DNA-binding LytR/AlgR family response regulator